MHNMGLFNYLQVWAAVFNKDKLTVQMKIMWCEIFFLLSPRSGMKFEPASYGGEALEVNKGILHKEMYNFNDIWENFIFWWRLCDIN